MTKPDIRLSSAEVRSHARMVDEAATMLPGGQGRSRVRQPA